ncbi:FtsK/SpoIIIE domain-containing protein [Modestobacter sp. Leaf380]|uniref:FtsK/SpoIIIE domain-containing protein n=1 Tax=Modestobacter sp. Leaf380 TaxID=1736356 RepID=UPI0006F55A22|nr:FtsK/SpoIIIE domain-containing protein [Modestobacter sp. Leaf380]KQS73382.1 hypothetical protein ASG41_01580 [Modestobacter sp. Leaf380]
MSAPTTEPPADRESGVRCWTLHSSDGARDVVVRAPGHAVLGDLLPALPGGVLWAGSRTLRADTPLTDPDLAHGAELGLGRPGPRTTPATGALELHVAGGPDAGRVLPLTRGRVTVGRGRGRTLALDDPDVSRHHVTVAVTGTGVTVADAGSSNGTHRAADGHPLGPEPLGLAPLGADPLGADPEPWHLGTLVRLGASSLRLAAPGGRPLPVTPAAGGRLAVRPARRPVPAAPAVVAVAVPAAPTERPRRALAWIAVAVPAVAGVLMAWLLSAPQFLFFALLSPVVALGTWTSDRWSGRRGHRRAVTDHALALVDVEVQVAAAVAAEVAAREQAAPDLAALLTAARRRSDPLWGRGHADRRALVVRLGSGPGATGVTRLLEGAVVEPTHHPHLPVALDLRGGGLGVQGPREAGLRTARALLCQVAALHPPGDVRVELLCPPSTARDWAWARWLPHLGTGPGAPGTLRLVVVDLPVDASAVQQVRELRAAGASCVVLSSEPTALDADGSPVLALSGETGSAGRLSLPGEPDSELTVDGASTGTAAELARQLAPLCTPAGPGGLPTGVRWRDVAPRRPWSRSRSTLTATLGVGPRGPVELDLCAAGPHALVAGTTGSGKSELLRTLVLGLAAAHPPDRCSLLLVDYKGGSAFAEAAALPHTVGLLTDLDGASTARALRSLTAELTRRETVLAEHGVRDLTALPEDVLLPRLVIVVDEFATLSDELPGFVPGLVGIAQRGRSLGVHLVLATQRPAGVVSPEIRANCTVRLCLRTTDEAGSRDVLGLPDAAWLPVDTPGRALLRVGAESPVPVQVARVAVPTATAAGDVAVGPWSWPAPPRLPVAPAAPDGGPTDLAALVAELTTRAAAAGLGSPPRPWLPPLPDRVPPRAGPARPGPVVWGLRDRPDQQAQDPLLLDLAEGGSWLLPGGPGSGRTTALRTVLGEAVHALPPERLHVHVVDHGGGTVAAAALGLPHTGTVLGRDDGHRLVRLLTRLQEEVDRRRADGTPGALQLLLVDGVDGVLTALEELLPGTGTGLLLRLVRDGAAVGLTTVLTADRVLPGGRLAAAVGRRLVLPFADRADYVVAGVPARAVPGHRPPGRALSGEDADLVQLSLPRPLSCAPGQVADPRRIRVVELPADPRLPVGDGPVSGSPVVDLGPGGDGGEPVRVDLARSGGLLVCGPAGSGRTNTLAALAARLLRSGTPVAALVPRADRTWNAAGGPAPTADLAGWAAGLGGRVGVLAVDDLHLLDDVTADRVTALCRPGGAVLLLAASTAADVAAAFRGPVVALRRARSALVLRPGRGDAELLSLRLPRAPLPVRPGSGWLATDGTVTRVQVAREPVPMPVPVPVVQPRAGVRTAPPPAGTRGGRHRAA